MDLTERKKQILKRVVEDYIAAAEPVGSIYFLLLLINFDPFT